MRDITYLLLLPKGLRFNNPQHVSLHPTRLGSWPVPVIKGGACWASMQHPSHVMMCKERKNEREQKETTGTTKCDYYFGKTQKRGMRRNFYDYDYYDDIFMNARFLLRHCHHHGRYFLFFFLLILDFVLDDSFAYSVGVSVLAFPLVVLDRYCCDGLYVRGFCSGMGEQDQLVAVLFLGPLNLAFFHLDILDRPAWRGPRITATPGLNPPPPTPK